MMRSLLTSFIGAILFLNGVDALAEAKGRVELTKLTDRIYVVEDHFYYRENSAIYIGEKDVTVISATWTPQTAQLLADKVRTITNKPIKAVVNTHFHLDRVGGNSYFKGIGAKIIASKMTTDMMKKTWDARITSAKKDYPGYPSISYVAPDVIFDDKYDLEGGKIQVRYFGPSHTEDGTVVYFPDEQVLFGDCIVKEKLGWLGDANVDEYPRTLQRIKKLKIKTIIAGHWTPIHGPELIDQMLELLKKRESKSK